MALFNAWTLSFIMLFQAVAASNQFIVGGGNGWVPPFGFQKETYNQWAGRNRFQVGDLLVFKYNPNQDSVLQVNTQDYDACKTTTPIASFKDGNTVFTFPKHGPFYFISGNAANCQKGEKLNVVVMAPRNPAGASTPSLAPASTALTPSHTALTPSPSRAAATPSTVPFPSPSHAAAAPTPTPSLSKTAPSPSPYKAAPSPSPSKASPSPSPSKAVPSPAPSVAPPAVTPAPASSVPSPSPALTPLSEAPSPAAPIVASPQPSQDSGVAPSFPPSAAATTATSLAASCTCVSAAATVVALLFSGLILATL